MTNDTTTKSKIFFDGNCIVCDTEISHYKRIAPQCFEMIDISAKDFNAGQYNLSAIEVTKNMHALTPEGELKIGVDAFAHIWSRIPKYQLGARLILMPGIYSLAKLGYAAFALSRPYLPKKKRSNS